ncbi:hypothetical protein ACKWTF_004357 [Chironomus riparius]
MFGLNAVLTQPFINDEYTKKSENDYFWRIGLVTNDYLSKGHINPSADHPFQSWTKATYFYLNHLPQWQQLNQGVWLKIENFVRNESKTKDLVIFTGGHGVYSFRGQNLYIVDKYRRVEVPKFIWKLVITPRTSIAFVIMNTKSDSQRDPRMCSDRDLECLSFKGFDDYINKEDAGFLSCCNEESLYKMIGYRLR